MGTQSHTQKKYPVSQVETHTAFKPHQIAVQTRPDPASQSKQTAAGWQTQLSRAKQLGHNLSRVQVFSNPPIQRQEEIGQRKLHLQASVVDEEQEQDEEASKMQRKSEGEQNSLLAKLATPALTLASPDWGRSQKTNTNHLSVKESTMSTQEHIQKKPLATTPAPRLRNGFETRGFAVQSKSDKVSSVQSGDLKTQLSRATRFGHNVAALQTKAPTGQGNLPVQREEEKKEPEQMKAAPTIQRQEEKEPEQMKAEQTAHSAIQRQPTPQAASSGSSHSMPQAVRAKMEKSFGTSFSDVSIHTESVQAKSIGALAYTQGSNIHFAPGQYNPKSPSGQALLGHELTHVVQQRAGRVPMPHQSKGSAINADPALEKEADDMGAKAARGQLAQVPGATGGQVASSASPVQNSTQPVQFFLPLLMGALGGPAGIAGMAGNLLGGMGGGGQQQQAGGGAGGGGGGGGGGLLGGIGGALGGLLGGLI